jgi:hypothetical protein
VKHTNFLSSEQVSRIWTLYSADTIREMAARGALPVAVWIQQEPIFARDAATIRALTEVTNGNCRTAA